MNMRFTLPRRSLEVALQAVAPLARLTAAPLSGQMLIDADGERVEFVLFDGIYFLRAAIPATVTDAGASVVPHAPITRLAETWCTDDVQLKLDGERVEVRAGTDRVTVPRADPADYSRWPTIVRPGAAIQAGALASVLRPVLFALSPAFDCVTVRVGRDLLDARVCGPHLSCRATRTLTGDPSRTFVIAGPVARRLVDMELDPQSLVTLATDDRRLYVHHAALELVAPVRDDQTSSWPEPAQQVSTARGPQDVLREPVDLLLAADGDGARDHAITLLFDEARLVFAENGVDGARRFPRTVDRHGPNASAIVQLGQLADAVRHAAGRDFVFALGEAGDPVTIRGSGADVETVAVLARMART